MNKSLTTLACLIMALSLSAQKNTLDGFYISPAGDSVKGAFTGYSPGSKSPANFHFQPGSGEEKVLAPADCRMVMIDGKNMYISYQGERAINPITLSGITKEETAYNYEPVSSFLRVVFKSKNYILAILEDGVRENYFIQPAAGKTQELLYRVNSSSGSIAHINTFRQQLANILSSEMENNKNLEEKISNATYSESDLVAVLNATEKNETVDTKPKGELVILAGAALNSYEVTPANASYPFSNTEYDNNVSAALAIGYNIYTRKGYSGFFINPEVRYVQLKHEGSATHPVTGSLHTNSYEGSLFSLAVLIGKNWVNNEKLKWYTSLGPAVNMLVNYKHSETIKATNTTTSSSDELNKNISGSLFIQTGVMFSKHLGIWIAYKVPHNLGNYSNYKTKSASLQGGLELRF